MASSRVRSKYWSGAGSSVQDVDELGIENDSCVISLSVRRPNAWRLLVWFVHRSAAVARLLASSALFGYPRMPTRLAG